MLRQESSAVFSNSFRGSVTGTLEDLWRVELLGKIGWRSEVEPGASGVEFGRGGSLELNLWSSAELVLG